MATLQHSAHSTRPMASPMVIGTPQTPGALTIGGREVNGNSEIQLCPLGGEQGRLPAPWHRDTILQPHSGFSLPRPIAWAPLPQPAPHTPMPLFCVYFPAPLPPCHSQAEPSLSPLSLPQEPQPWGSQGAGGLPAPHSPAPYVVNEGELRLNREGQQCHLWAQGIRSGAPPTWHTQQVEQHQPLEGRRPRNSSAPLTVPEFTYFFFLHFFLGFSTCRHRGESVPAWSAPCPYPDPPSYLIHRELTLCSRQLPVAGGKFPNEVVAAGGAQGQYSQALG